MWRADSVEKNPNAGKVWRQEEKVTTEDEMVGWHHRLDGTRIWVNSGSWWWTGRPGMLRFMGSQRVRHGCATELKRELFLPDFLRWDIGLLWPLDFSWSIWLFFNFASFQTETHTISSQDSQIFRLWLELYIISPGFPVCWLQMLEVVRLDIKGINFSWLISKVYKQLMQHNTRKINDPIKEWIKKLNRHFFI